MELNADIERTHPDLFNQFIKPINSGQIAQVIPVPPDTRTPNKVILKTYTAKLLSRTGQILVFSSLLIILLHTVTFMPCMLCSYYLCRSMTATYGAAFIGVIVTPCIVVSL